MGIFAAYLIISIFIGLIGGYIAGYIVERKYLLQLEPRACQFYKIF